MSTTAATTATSLGAIPGVANVFQKQVLGVPESSGGLFAEISGRYP